MSLFLVVLLLLVFVWFFFTRSTNSKKTVNRKAEKGARGEYHCVTVQFAKGACEAVKALEGQRILSSEGPALPLPGCNVDKCDCRFQHHEERRQEERRNAYNKAIDDIAGNTMTITPRSKSDRRK